MSNTNPTAVDQKVFLRAVEAAAYLEERWGIKRTRSYLAKQRCVGGGPAYHRQNRQVVYAPIDLDDYARSITSPPYRSTAEYARAGEDGHASAT